MKTFKVTKSNKTYLVKAKNEVDAAKKITKFIENADTGIKDEKEYVYNKEGRLLFTGTVTPQNAHAFMRQGAVISKKAMTPEEVKKQYEKEQSPSYWVQQFKTRKDSKDSFYSTNRWKKETDVKHLKEVLEEMKRYLRNWDYGGKESAGTTKAEHVANIKAVENRLRELSEGF